MIEISEFLIGKIEAEIRVSSFACTIRAKFSIRFAILGPVISYVICAYRVYCEEKVYNG